ncbi:MAG: pyridoxine 5'-phosphate synthase [Limisphaerales bacterium]|jgi:pyridoxine 5-phosphate synthase|nr:pyridoxine 5'-phosphate synthase [Verrucomicrobiota bacterium]
MLKLGVNIDHVATLRQARYKGREDVGEPNLLAAALTCEKAGAHCITVHLREDRRHIQDRDVFELREKIQTRLNLEMANIQEIIQIALRVKPDIVCIVPERHMEVTTEGGLNAVRQEKYLAGTIGRLLDAGIEVSLFITADPEQIRAAARLKSPFIELYTGGLAETVGTPREEKELERLIAGAQLAHELGIKVNAGHGINYMNMDRIYRIPHLVELNIGHSIISRAMATGLEEAVRQMLKLMEPYSL